MTPRKQRRQLSIRLDDELFARLMDIASNERVPIADAASQDAEFFVTQWDRRGEVGLRLVRRPGEPEDQEPQ